MPTTIKGQVLASTAMDAHGEQRDKQSLDDMLASLPKRMPLNQHHEHGLPTVGTVENFRVEPDGDGWALKGDVTFEGDPPTEGGFSFSTTVLVHRSKEPRFALHVPYPHYRDEDLLSELATANPDASVGKWIKKAITPADVALIISALNFLLGPGLKVFEDKIQPRLAPLATALIDTIQSKRGARVRADFLQPVRCDHYKGTIELFFIPSEHAELKLAYGFAVKEAIEHAKDLVDADWKTTKKPIKRIVHIYEPDACRFRVSEIIYSEGGSRRP